MSGEAIVTLPCNNLGIDTTASYSPDGKNIIFSSDRSGSQQLYIMSSDGLSLQKISNGGGSYSKPVWSKNGKFIAFTKIKGGKFFVCQLVYKCKGIILLYSFFKIYGLFNEL
jgi:TolB protein